jgi:hypothetical protein
MSRESPGNRTVLRTSRTLSSVKSAVVAISISKDNSSLLLTRES